VVTPMVRRAGWPAGRRVCTFESPARSAAWFVLRFDQQGSVGAGRRDPTLWAGTPLAVPQPPRPWRSGTEAWTVLVPRIP
jgi:hypothetical protein